MPSIIVIGERLNSSNPAVKRLLRERDTSAFLQLAEAQVAGGASFIDLNAAMLMKDEENTLIWGARCIIEELGAKVSLDSPKLDILLKVIGHFGSDAVLNSLMSDEDALSRAVPVLADSGAGVIVMLKGREGIPGTIDGRLRLAEKAASKISNAGIPAEKVFFDPVFSPLATSQSGLNIALETFVELRRHYPDFQRIGGLSNISYGLPLRRLINRTFLSMAVSSGLTAVICDPTDARLMETLRASEVIIGLDPGCREFLQYYRKMKKQH